MFGGPSGRVEPAADGGDRGGESSGSDIPPGGGAGAPAPDPESAAAAADNKVLHNRTKKRGGKRERRRIAGIERAIARGEELVPTQALGRHGYTHFPDAADEEYVTYRPTPPPVRGGDAPPAGGAASSGLTPLAEGETEDIATLAYQLILARQAPRSSAAPKPSTAPKSSTAPKPTAARSDGLEEAQEQVIIAASAAEATAPPPKAHGVVLDRRGEPVPPQPSRPPPRPSRRPSASRSREPPTVWSDSAPRGSTGQEHPSDPRRA